MKKSKLTLSDIASALNVSVSTVSKSLKDSPEIGKETKDRVIAYANEHHYQPNFLAQALQNHSTKLIGLIVPDLYNNFFDSIIEGVNSYANERGYNTIVCFSNDRLEKEISDVELLSKHLVEGVILSLASETESSKSFDHLERLVKANIPIVQFDRVEYSLKGDKVVIDDEDSAYRAVINLAHKGKSKIAFIGSGKHLSVEQNRMSGYERGLVEAGLSLNKQLICILDTNEKHDIDIANFLNSNEIDSVLCTNEVLGVQTLRVAQQLPQYQQKKLLVIGYANGFLSKYSNPPLSSIDQHGVDIGLKSTELLLDRIQANEELEDRVEIIRSTLIERDSTRLIDIS